MLDIASDRTTIGDPDPRPAVALSIGEECYMMCSKKCVLVSLVLLGLTCLAQSEGVEADDDWAVRETIDFELTGGPIRGHFTVEAAASDVSILSGQEDELFVESIPGSAYLSFDVLGYGIDVPLAQTPLGKQSHRVTGFSIPFIGDITIYIDISGVVRATIDEGNLNGTIFLSPRTFTWYDWGLKVATVNVPSDAYGADISGSLDLRFEYLVSVGVSVDVPFLGRISVGQIELTTLMGEPTVQTHILVSLRPAPVSISVDFPNAHEAVLSWQQSSDSEFVVYEVEVSGDNANSVFRVRDRTRTTTTVQVTPDSDYIFSITVEDADSLRSRWSDVSGRSPPDPPPPAVSITSVEVDGSSMSMTVLWDFTQVDDFSRYEVVLNGEVISLIRDLDHNESTLSGLKAGETYSVCVVIYDEWENSAISNIETTDMPLEASPRGLGGDDADSGSTNAITLGFGILGGLIAYLLITFASKLLIREKKGSPKRDETD